VNFPTTEEVASSWVPLSAVRWVIAAGAYSKDFSLKWIAAAKCAE
jgi:hypothetical protein